jgi:hypothetical protein
MLLTQAGAGPQATSKDPDAERRPYPGAKNMVDEMLKVEYAKTLEDAAKLVELAEDLKIELEKNDRHILSIAAIKKTEDIEKLAKRIRSRIRR